MQTIVDLGAATDGAPDKINGEKGEVPASRRAKKGRWAVNTDSQASGGERHLLLSLAEG